jgi:hypothetical protein
MALVTRKEFAEMCGVDVNYINTYVSRKKISVLPSKKIDTDNPLNVIFKKNLKKTQKEKLEEQRAEKRERKTVPKVEELSEFEKKRLAKLYAETVEVFTPEETPRERREREKQNEDDKETVSWDLRKKIADAKRAERAAEKELLMVEKMMGNLMPVDMVEQILRVNIQDIFKTFENELINLASIYCDILAGGNREKLADIIKKIRHKLEDTVKRIETTAAQEIENVVSEYAESRSRGERK